MPTKHPRHHSHHPNLKLGRLDYTLLVIIIVLLIIGVIMVYEASVVEAYQMFSDKLYFAKLQLKWSLVGLGALAAGTFVPIKLVKKAAPAAFFISIVLLLIVLIPGVGTHAQGARRWINFGFVVIQPSELAKLTLILYLSALFEKKTTAFTFLSTLGITAGLIMLEPDLGTTVVLSTLAIGLFFLARAPLAQFLTISLSAVAAATTLIASSTYRRQRLLTFLDPSRDPLGASYHIRQVLIALGSGGFFGNGIGRSLAKYQYLPEATTDSIFAVIVEETGFLGTMAIISLFMIITYRGLAIAARMPDKFMSLLASGITILIAFQAFLNLGAMSALVPLTGVTLPFISYGGSSLVITLAASGLLLNLSRYQQS